MATHLEHQKTIAKECRYQGIGLHSGSMISMTLLPAQANTGIIFQRTDVADGPVSILSNFSNVVAVDHSTDLGDRLNRCRVQTVEHLLAVLHAVGIDNLLVILDGPEVPIADGSSRPLLKAIEKAGIKELPAFKAHLRIKKAIEYREGDKFIRISPSKKFKVTYHIEFASEYIGRQSYTFTLSRTGFRRKIAGARTFCLEDEVTQLKAAGLAKGGSLDNAVVVGKNGVLNGGLRYKDEFVRHKVLDAVGDMYLLGTPVQGHVEVYKGGHALHNKLISRLLARPDAYETTNHALTEDMVSSAIPSAVSGSVSSSIGSFSQFHLCPLPNNAL